MLYARIGQGFDSHRFAHGRRLCIGGVDIPHEQGLEGHSDADVLLHAIIDAMLGAAGLGDIGQHFSDQDSRYCGISSRVLLKESAAKLVVEGYAIVNIDSTLIAESPRLSTYIPVMRQNIADDLGLMFSDVNVKAKTAEKMGSLGRSKGIAALAVVLLKK